MPINLPEEFKNRIFTPNWFDEFDTDGPVDPEQWRFESMDDALHRAGNSGMDRNGNIAPDKSAKGHRWAAEYDRFHDQLAYIEGGKLIMKGKLVKESKPTRANYTHNGRLQAYGDNRLYTVWLDHFARIWTPKGHIIDPDSPGRTFGPGTYIETKVDFSQKCVPGHRSNLFLMPALDKDGYLDVSKAYDDDASNGVEIDIFEHDVAMPNLLLCKAIGGAAGMSTPRAINAQDYGINLMVGTHTIALLWEIDALYWFLDGVLVLTDKIRVPQVRHFLIMAREMNSGVKNVAHGWTERYMRSVPPFIPSDPGLFAVSVLDNAHKLDEDLSIVHYVRAYRVTKRLTEEPAPLPPKKLTWKERLAALRKRVNTWKLRFKLLLALASNSVSFTYKSVFQITH